MGSNSAPVASSAAAAPAAAPVAAVSMAADSSAPFGYKWKDGKRVPRTKPAKPQPVAITQDPVQLAALQKGADTAQAAGLTGLATVFYSLAGKRHDVSSTSKQKASK